MTIYSDVIAVVKIYNNKSKRYMLIMFIHILETYNMDFFIEAVLGKNVFSLKNYFKTQNDTEIYRNFVQLCI